jgi:hypothetical protein
MRVHARRDAGQATVLLLAVVALTVVTMVATAHFASRVATRDRAQAAADAAALAGTTGGRPAAAQLAAANGAVLVAFAVVGEAVQVTVVIDGETATARATRAP